MTYNRTHALVLVATAILCAVPAAAQVGKSVTVKDANSATEAEIAATPPMTAALAKELEIIRDVRVQGVMIGLELSIDGAPIVKVTINGFTQSQARVSTLMRNLESSQHLESPALVEIKAVVRLVPLHDYAAEFCALAPFAQGG